MTPVFGSYEAVQTLLVDAVPLMMPPMNTTELLVVQMVASSAPVGIVGCAAVGVGLTRRAIAVWCDECCDQAVGDQRGV